MIALLALLSVARAADPTIDAVKAELARDMAELSLPDAPGPYHVAALVFEHTNVSVQATLGGIVTARSRPSRSLGVVVRTGSTALDNTNFESWQSGVGARGLVLASNALAIRKDVWLLVDRMYKEAVEALAAKEAAARRRADPDDVPDFAPGAPQVASAPPAPPFDEAALATLARSLSAVFVTRPEIEYSMVFVDGQAGRRLMIDTGGVEVIEPSSELAVRVVARVRASDGATQIDEASWIVRSLDQLPAPDVLKVEVEALATRLEAWRKLPVLEEEYVGPVVFEDGAAVDVVRHLLVPALIGTPAPEAPAFGSRVMSFEEEHAGPMQPRRRILPSGWTVDDDPERDPTRASAYRYDSEGQPAQRVELVRDGIVRAHLMSRIPSEAFPESNGHGRGGPGELVGAMASDFAVSAKKTSSRRAIHKAATKLAGQYGLDGYLVVRRLREPSVEWMDGGPLLSMRDLGDGPALSGPIEVIRVHADGREEVVRGAAIGGLDVRAFKEVVLAGKSQTETYLQGQGSVFSGPNEGYPVTVTVPDLLFSELVVSPDKKDAEKPPRLPSPLAGRDLAER